METPRAATTARSGSVQWRQQAVMWLALVLAVFVLESARHAGHHADDSEAAACVIASAAAHVLVVSAPAVVAAPVAHLVGSLIATTPPSAPSIRPLGVDQGRAPPLLLSV